MSMNGVETDLSQQYRPAPLEHHAKTPSRRYKMSAARLERRRAVDRESQRATRARTKAHICHLEQTIAAMERSSNNEHISSLMKQIQQQQEEIDRLNTLVSNVRKLLAVTPDNHENITVRHGREMASSPSESQSEEELRPEHTLSTSDTTLTKGSALCPFTSSLKCGDGERNYFGALNTAFEFIHSSGRSTVFAGLDQSVDDDIAIRAILHGWDAVKDKYDLDLGWQFLRALDQGLYQQSDPVVRLANLRSVRGTLMVKLYGHCLNRRQQPQYMAPTDAQKSIKHPLVVDYFVWPQVRDYLILTATTSSTEKESSHFATHLRFRFPYELRDACRRHKETGTYTYSQTFDDIFNDLANWTVDPAFYSASNISPLLLSPRYLPVIGEPQSRPQPHSPSIDEWQEEESLSIDGNCVPHIQPFTSIPPNSHHHTATFQRNTMAGAYCSPVGEWSAENYVSLEYGWTA